MNETNKKYLLGADIGTTSLKCAVFDTDGNMIKSATKDYTLIVSGDDVEFPADDYVKLFEEAYNEVSEGLEISAFSIDTQCETIIVTDENDKPLMNAIVWLDNRAAKQAEEIKEYFGNKRVYEVTGQPEITATWPAAKLLWIKQNKPEIHSKISKVFLLEDYLLYKLTGNFVTEKTLQSSTIYFDIKANCWWKEMLDYIGVGVEMLPELLDSGVYVGDYNGIKVCTGAMDQVSGAIGAGIVKRGIVSVMTGTTMVIFTPYEEFPAYNPDSIVPCHYNYDGKYCLLFWSPTAGMALKWFRNALCENYSFMELDEMAKDIAPGSDGVTFLPYLCGSTMPKYNPEARGSFTGLTTEHGRAHFVKAVMESVACMLKSNLEYLDLDISEIRAMGGGASSPLWCQIKSDMTGKRLVTLKNKETACLGAAILAGVGVGEFESVESACEMIEIGRAYSPSGADYSACYERYVKYDELLNI